MYIYIYIYIYDLIFKRSCKRLQKNYFQKYSARLKSSACSEKKIFRKRSSYDKKDYEKPLGTVTIFIEKTFCNRLGKNTLDK